MENNYIPYGRQLIQEDDIQSVIEVLRSPLITQGPVIEEFEEAVARKVKARYGVAVNSATSALHVACLSLGLGKGDWAWTTPITFVASANCALYTGAQVDFVDIDQSGLMSIEKLRTKLEQSKANNKLPKVLIPVHLGGTSCNMEEIHKLGIEYNFSIIEDASHAIGGEYKNDKVGSCKYSDITIFSFHPVKIITTGEGGMAITNNKLLKERMKKLRSHGITKDKKEFVNKNVEAWYYEQQLLGFNYRMTDIQAALGISQLQKLDRIIQIRTEQANYYMKNIKNTVEYNMIPQDCKCAYHLFTIKTHDRQKELFERLRSKNIGSQLHYLPIHLQPFYRKLGYMEGDYKEAEEYSKSRLSIPIFPGLTRNQQDIIISEINKVFQ